MNLTSKACLLTVLIGSLSYSQAYAEDNIEPSVGEKLDDAISAVKEFTVDNKDKAIETMTSALTHLDDRIDALNKKIQKEWNTMDDNTQKEARKSLNILQEKRAHMATWIEEMKTSGSETWDKMKNGISDAFTAFQNSDEDEAPVKENAKPVKIITI